MLHELVVAGLAAIDKAEISLGPGCSALTGETGAGKTLLVAALGLLSGARADRSLVRDGVSEATIEGRFSIPPDHPAGRALTDAGLIEDIGEEHDVVVSRVIATDGRSGKVRVNGRLTTLGVLAELGGSMIEIAGQHAHQRLGDGGVQRALLDSFAGPATQELAGRVATAVRAAHTARRELAELTSGARQRERDLDVLRYEIDEIEAARLEPGESERLAAEAARLEHAETIGGALSSAARLLGGEGGGSDTLESARSQVEQAAALDPRLGELHERIRSLTYEVADVVHELRAADISPDPDALAETRDRLGAIGRLKRKFGSDEAEILGYLSRARARFEELASADERLDELRSRVDGLTHEAMALAEELSDARRSAAASLTGEIEVLLAELALEGARFEVGLESCELYEGGLERVEFRVAVNPGESPRPLAKVASGGELSRIALALHVATGTGTAETLVFDEVDAGVGGEAAQTVGRTLARLAGERDAQVLVVTHLPQVAAFADHQYRVTKRARGGRAQVEIERVEGTARVEELSRMLAGLPESDRARGHAEELLEMAGRSRR